MKKLQKFLAIIFMCMLPLMLSCGGGGDGGDEGDGGGVTVYKTADYYPLGQGDTWTYRETEEDGEIEYETKTVSGTETIDGVVATKVLEDSDEYELFTNSNGITFYKSYDINEEDGVVEEEVDILDPPLIYVPTEVSIGTKHTFNSTIRHTENGFSATGTISIETTVEGIENVTVPAGTFENCLKIKIKRNVASSDGSHTESTESTIWLAKGVGIVKDTGQGTETNNGEVDVDTWTDELVSATVGGVSYPK